MKKSKRKDSSNVLRLEGEMTIYRAGELSQQVLSPLRAQPADLRLDLAAVTEFDTSGLQVLLMARRLASAGGVRIEIVKASECVHEVLRLCNLTDLLATEGKAA